MFAMPIMSGRIDLRSIWEEHTAQEFVHKNVDATMRTMVQDPHVVFVPVAMGERGREDVRRFYSQWPGSRRR